MTIRVRGLAEAAAQRAIDVAFGDVTRIHRLMSFHEPESDVSRLNRAAAARPQRVAPETLDVLRAAHEVAELSRGCFDVTIAPALVGWGFLPAPCARRRPHAAASWRDVELGLDGRVRFRRPLWIDLGGIAKGYAVDRAVERLEALGAHQGCVDAGGDLRVFGPRPERVWLRPDTATESRLAVLELVDASVASSSGRLGQRRGRGPHLDGARRAPVGTRSFASVVAGRCMVADALTKIVLARGRRADVVLRHFGATAHLHGPSHRWAVFGARA